eukprot:TRINITY_DN18105_c0_g1_i2.p9 TRINITY_DN18105_c0_g1~~TRINITY_DN18105_c0_g1_i2.p9  ORF type:complete len:134 (+),score=6.21 TRINITY_DN18105_c0_g1_i2:1604-2005(+)
MGSQAGAKFEMQNSRFKMQAFCTIAIFKRRENMNCKFLIKLCFQKYYPVQKFDNFWIFLIPEKMRAFSASGNCALLSRNEISEHLLGPYAKNLIRYQHRMIQISLEANFSPIFRSDNFFLIKRIQAVFIVLIA